MLNSFTIQIYEVQEPAEAQMLLDIGVNYIGSVILSEHNRNDPLLKQTINTVKASKAKSSLIPLFSNIENIIRAIDYYKPDIIHFCDNISDTQNPSGKPSHEIEKLILNQEKVKTKFPEIKITRSVPIARPGLAHLVPTIELAAMFEDVSDCFLTDTLLVSNRNSKPEKQPVTDFVGITGLVCDWDMAAKLVKSSRIPVILAGGISPDNVFESILKCKPSGIDSCTNTNMVDAKGSPIRFKKDANKVKRLINEVRKAVNILKRKDNQEDF